MFIVCLDAGHGGKDPGACANRLQEKVMNFNTMLGAKEELEAHGVKVVTTRSSDIYLSLGERCKISNKSNADLFVSIHHNAGGGDRAECIYSVNETENTLGYRTAKFFKQEFEAIGQTTNVYSKRGTSGDYFAVIRGTAAPAIICEICFVDNKKDVEIADTVEEQKRNGKMIANAILKACGIIRTTTPKPQTLNKSKASYFNIAAESSIARAAAKEAAEQIGKPYIYGDEGPNSFDCSGLIDYCYRKAGYEGFGRIRQTTSTLAKAGMKINSFKELQSGDIILPTSGHVIMYVGDTFTVEAQCEKTGVVKRKLSDLNEKNCNIRRIVAREYSEFVAGYFNKIVKITSPTLNIKAKRDADSKIVGSLAYGEDVLVGNINSAIDGSLWGSVNINGVTGYINMSYAKKI